MHRTLIGTSAYGKAKDKVPRERRAQTLFFLPSVWPRRTLISTSAYGKANKVPQEAVPQEVQDKVREKTRSVCVWGGGGRCLLGRGAV